MAAPLRVVSDLVVLLVMGVVGYALRKMKFDVAPLVLAVVLGPLMEKSFRQGLFMSQGDLSIFVTRPISGALLAVTVVVILWPLLWRLVRRDQRPSVQLPAES